MSGKNFTFDASELSSDEAEEQPPVCELCRGRTTPVHVHGPAVIESGDKIYNYYVTQTSTFICNNVSSCSRHRLKSSSEKRRSIQAASQKRRYSSDTLVCSVSDQTQLDKLSSSRRPSLLKLLKKRFSYPKQSQQLRKKEPDNNQLEEETRRRALIDCEDISAIVPISNSLTPVSLQIADDPRRVAVDLKFSRVDKSREDFMKLCGEPAGNVSEDEILQFLNGNRVICVVGQAGIGKTTCMKRWVKKLLDEDGEQQASCVFFIFVKYIDFSRPTTFLKFLLSTMLPNWEHSDESDRYWLRILSEDPNVVVALDGLDEAAAEELSAQVPRVNLFDESSPLFFLLNLINGTLLPYARVIISSRPACIYNLHPSQRPEHVFQILGLNSKAQDELGRQICSENYDTIRAILMRNAGAFAYCYVPVNFILTVDYLMRRNCEADFVCLTKVLASACVKYSVSDHLNGKDCELDKLSKLAWSGYRNMQITFETKDIQEADIGENTIGSFLTTSILSSANLKMTIMDGYKRRYFTHLIWQEFFAALYLMMIMPLDDFVEQLPLLTKCGWSSVARFSFGLSSEPTFNQMKCVIPGAVKTSWEKKKTALVNVILSRMRELRFERFTPSPGPQPQPAEATTPSSPTIRIIDSYVVSSLLEMFSWLHEANEEMTTKMISPYLPEEIVLPLHSIILPSDISNLFFVLRLVQDRPTLRIKKCRFAADCLHQFCQEVSKLHVQVQHFDLSWNHIFDSGLSSISSCVQCIQELMLYGCKITKKGVAELADKLIETKHTISFLDLGRNLISDQGIIALSRSIQYIRSLSLWQCGITSDGVKEFAKKLLETEHMLEYLDFSGNSIGEKGAKSLIPCFPQIKDIRLFSCGISQDAQDALLDLAKLGLSLNLDFSWDCGGAGADAVRSPAHTRRSQGSSNYASVTSDEAAEDEAEDGIDELFCSVLNKEKIDEENVGNPLFPEKETQNERSLLIHEASALIGPKGGKMEVGGCKVFVPKGALLQEVNITLTSCYGRLPNLTKHSSHNRITPTLCCEPHGLQFEKCVDVILPTSYLTDGHLVAEAEARHSEDGKKWSTLKRFDYKTERCFQFTIQSFSWYDVIVSNILDLSIEKQIVCCIPHKFSDDPEQLVAVFNIFDSILEHKQRSCTDLFKTSIALGKREKDICFRLLNKDISVSPNEVKVTEARVALLQQAQFLLSKQQKSMLFTPIEMEMSTDESKTEKEFFIFNCSTEREAEESSKLANNSTGCQQTSGVEVNVPDRTILEAFFGCRTVNYTVNHFHHYTENPQKTD